MYSTLRLDSIITSNYLLSACTHYGESLLESVSTALICRSVNAKEVGILQPAKLRIQNPEPNKFLAGLQNLYKAF